MYYDGNTMNEELITIRLSKVDLQRINLAVKNGHYTNRSDFIRTAVRKLADQLVDIPEMFLEIWEEAKKRGITDKDVVKWSKEARKKAHRRKR